MLTSKKCHDSIDVQGRHPYKLINKGEMENGNNKQVQSKDIQQ